MLRALVPNVETLGYYRMSLRDNDVARFCGACLEANPSSIGLPCLPYRRFPNLRRANAEQFYGLRTGMSALQQVWKPMLHLGNTPVTTLRSSGNNATIRDFPPR